MGYRTDVHGKGLGLNGDKTTTGAVCSSTLRHATQGGRGILRVGDPATACKKCGKPGKISEGDKRMTVGGLPVAVDRAKVLCGCPPGANRLIAPSRQWLGQGDPPGGVWYHRPAANPQALPEQHAQRTKKQREITLTLGVFFDGTGNNAVNIQNMARACFAKHYSFNDVDAQTVLAKCAIEKKGISGIGATSYTGYYTNVHWLSKLYKTDLTIDNGASQQAIYIEGIGTRSDKPDSTWGQALGISDTGVIAKTDNAIAGITQGIKSATDNFSGNVTIKSFHFDIFGFSRGAAAARHFANRIAMEDGTIINAIRQGMADIDFRGAPAGKTRFLGIFDTVAAIGTPINGLNPHNADTGDVNIALRPGVAEKVFHITAQHECRFNFALNSVRPAWPELALPGTHSDIGGGYLPLEKENLFLSRPRVETVSLKQPGEKTRVYKLTLDELNLLHTFPAIAPVLRANNIQAETWFDDRMPQDRYSNFQKRSFAALTLRDRVVKNDWSKVVLRVMLDAARDAGVMFEELRDEDDELVIASELKPLCAKAIAMGKAARAGQTASGFSNEEIDLIAKNYIHCSANWNAFVADVNGMIQGGASPSEIIGFTNRPDKCWRRTVYNMDGKKP